MKLKWVTVEDNEGKWMEISQSEERLQGDVKEYGGWMPSDERSGQVRTKNKVDRISN